MCSKKAKSFARLAIGTAQFGMAYGAMNLTGQPNLEEVRRMLAYARHGGVSCLDTAAAYGESESVLGMVGLEDWEVVTKLQPGEDPATSLARSLNRLRSDRLYGCLAHSADEWKRPGVAEALLQAKAMGKVQKIGVSVYSPEEFRTCLNHARPDLVQFPYNVVDQRMEKTGMLKEMYQNGIETHSRSVFWQGLLLAEPENLPQALGERAEILKGWHEKTTGVPKLKAALGFVLKEERIDKLVVGVETFGQIEGILGSVEEAANIDALPGVDQLACDDPLLVEPRHWQKN